MKAFKLLPALLLTVPAIASAEDVSVSSKHAPVESAFEIGVGAGYAQGVGELGRDLADLDDVAGPGGAVELNLGYRVIPELSVGAYGSFAGYQKGDVLADETNVLGVNAGIQATYHFRPAANLDPWVSLGVGWKGLWLSPETGKSTALQGIDFARLQIGADYRISKDIAIAPVIGGSLGTFLAADSPMTTEYTEIEDKQVSFTGFAGIAGRFDLASR
ncbi:MAG: hypothetical protein SFX73_02690 [Kofleriaceae bacterium]|nr:hypothetical protein [Kofleriaceae bacterium]